MLETKTYKKVWGEELWIANNELYCGKILRLKKGYKCSYHAHPIKDETFYILKGKVHMMLEESLRIMCEGDVLRINPGQYHSFTGLTDVEILEISTPHSDGDVIRKDVSGKVNDA